MTTIPNELIIDINTSIPGYQKIRFKPSMIIKNISNDDNKVRFDPLIKLKKSVIEKIPEDLRKKQFFNKGLFYSLIIYTNGEKAKTLNQATYEGFVDKNIKDTIETIFSENSIIYIGGKPYLIVDTQWTSGSWKIDTKKKKEEIDSSKITDPRLYQAVVKDEIISGEEELEALNPNIIYGPNYNGPKNALASGIKSKKVKKNEPHADEPDADEPDADEPDADEPDADEPETNEPEPNNLNALVLKQKIPKIKKPQRMSIETQTETILPPPKRRLIEPGPLPEAEIIEEFPNNTIQKNKNLENVIEPINKLKTSQRTTLFIKKIFSNRSFYYLINSIFNVSNQHTKKIINQNLLNYSLTQIRENNKNDMSITAYNQSVLGIKKGDNYIGGIKTIENEGRGDCFFIAVSDAINYYNFHNQSTRIINGIYGTGNNLYTQKVLRILVYEFIMNWSELDEHLNNITPVVAENLNRIFAENLNEIKNASRQLGNNDLINNEKYVEIARSTYKDNENFLVKNIDSVPIHINDYEKPFKPIERKNIKEYILSNDYWANTIAIYALCEKLKLNIIPISITKENKFDSPSVSIPFANFGTEYNKWKRYLFLYYYNSHFELITFNYARTEIVYDSNNRPIRTKIIHEKKIIFDRTNSINDLPPIYILFTIFGGYYSNILDENDKKKFTYQNDIMKAIDYNINNLLYPTEKYEKFYNTFKTFFKYSRIKEPEVIEEEEQEGGKNYYPPQRKYYAVPPQYYPPIPPPYYNPYYPYNIPAHKIMKRDENKEDSQLAYYITIDLQLHPGTTITPEELKDLKCAHKWNAVRKAWSEFTGTPYVIPPVYQTKTLKNKEQNENNKTQYKRPLPQNNTRKYRPKPNYSGGKKNKTIKLLY